MTFSWRPEGPRRPARPQARPRCRPALEPLEERAVPAGGDLDLSFSVDGKQTVGFDLGGQKFDFANAMAIDAQGRIVLAGSAELDNHNRDFAVVRLNPDGSLDNTFSGDGKQTVAFDIGGFKFDEVAAVAIDAQGRIVLAGLAEVANGNNDFAVARLNADGSLDNTFSGDGKQTVAFDIGGSKADYAGALALDAQGWIVLAGSAEVGNGNYNFAVARLDPDGSLDFTFGGLGTQIVAFDLGGSKADYAGALALDAQGRIVLAGGAARDNNNFDFAVARLNPNGRLDTTFSGDGKQTVGFDRGGQQFDFANAMAIDAQGRIVLAGYAEVGNGNHDFAVARLNSDGSLDTTFSGDATQTVAFDLGGSKFDSARALALDAQGRIVLAGGAERDNNNFDFAVARLNPDGSLDTTFSGDGKQTVAFDLGGPKSDGASAMALDAQGRIVLAGAAEVGNGNHDFAVARLIPDSAPPAPPSPQIVVPTPPLQIVVQQFRKRGVTRVRVRDAASGALRGVLTPFKDFRGRLRLLLRDLNGDGSLDLIVKAVINGKRKKKVFDAITLAPLSSRLA